MATQLQWRNIDVPNTGSALSGVVAANRDMRDSFRDLGQLFVDNTNRRRDEATNEAVARAAMATNLDGVAALRSALDPSNRMIDNIRVAEALNQRGQQVRADRASDLDFSITEDQVKGAPVRIAGIDNMYRTGQLFAGTGGAADFKYLDEIIRARSGYQDQQNNERDFEFGERKFTHEQNQDAFRNRLAEAQLAEQRNARAAAERRANADPALYRAGVELTNRLAATGRYSNDQIATMVNRQLGGQVKSASGAEALQSAVAFATGALSAETPEDRLTRGTVSDADTALRAADAFQNRARDKIAAEFTGSGLEATSARLAGKSIPEAMKELGIDTKEYPTAEFTNLVRRIQSENQGFSQADAVALASESLQPTLRSRLPIVGRLFDRASVDSDLVSGGAAALRNTRQAGTAEQRDFEIQRGDREVGEAIASLRSLAQREQTATAAGASDDVIGQIRQRRQDKATEVQELLRSRGDDAAAAAGVPYRGAPARRQQAPAAAKPFFMQYEVPRR